MDPKSPLLSKTLWFNVVFAILALVAPHFSGVLSDPANAGTVSMVETVLVTAVNFLLRLVTKQAIGLGD